MDYTPEQIKDIEERSKLFFEKYKALSDEFKIDLRPIPVYQIMSNGVFTTTCQMNAIDLKYDPQAKEILTEN